MKLKFILVILALVFILNVNFINAEDNGPVTVTTGFQFGINICDTEWVYGDWSDCINESQMRTGFRNCTDIIETITQSQSCSSSSNSSGCTEDWVCSGWDDCVDGFETRTCTDNNVCGTTILQPLTAQACIPECVENWACTAWGACQPEDIQTRTCTDQNLCSTNYTKPAEYIVCTYDVPSPGGGGSGCTEDWACTEWSDVTLQCGTRTCTNQNSCNTTETKPEETKDCPSSGSGGSSGGGGSSSGSSTSSSCDYSSNLLFHLPFEDSLESVQGHQPTYANEIIYTNGVVGKGLKTGGNQGLDYSTTGIINKDIGAFSFWLRQEYTQSDTDLGYGLNHFYIFDVFDRYDGSYTYSRLTYLVRNMYSENNFHFQANFETDGSLPNSNLYYLNNWENGELHHVVINYNLSDKIELYIDGNLVETTTENLPGQLAVLPKLLNIGYYKDTNAAHYPGMIDEFKIWDTPLAGSEILNEFSMSCTNNCVETHYCYTKEEVDNMLSEMQNKIDELEQEQSTLNNLILILEEKLDRLLDWLFFWEHENTDVCESLRTECSDVEIVEEEDPITENLNVVFRTNVLNGDYKNSRGSWIAVDCDENGILTGYGRYGNVFSGYMNNPLGETPEGYEYRCNRAHTEVWIKVGSYAQVIYKMSSQPSSTPELSSEPTNPYTSNGQEVYLD